MGIATLSHSSDVFSSLFRPFSINSENIVIFKLRIVSFNSELQDITFQLQEKSQNCKNCFLVLSNWIDR